MTRKIKFRAWDTVDKKMYLEALEIKDIGLGEGSVLVSEETQTDHPLKWMQFTGGFDKNENEIYEGDLLKFLNEGVYEVIWRDFYWGLEMDGHLYSGHGMYEQSEIMGDVYQGQFKK